MELYFIGSSFYIESGSRMSSIYTVEGDRTDWGKVNCSLEKGDSVHIRPATGHELKRAEAHLRQLKPFDKD